jgi:hypothetical protein
MTVRTRISIIFGKESSFGLWLKNHKKQLLVLGALIVIATYVSKDIFQTRMEAKIQVLERFALDARLDERLDRIEPNLRDELSRGTDARKKSPDQRNALFVNSGQYPPGFGAANVPFYSLVDMECEQDQTCRVAEWYRRRATIEGKLEANARLLKIVGEPGPFEFKGKLLAESEKDVETKVQRDHEAFENLKKGGVDRNDVDAFVAAISSLDQAVEQESSDLQIYVPSAVARLRCLLQIVGIVAGVLFFVGWLLSLVGQFYDLGSSPGSS